MNIHKNAKTTPKMRALIVARRQAGATPCQIALAIGVSSATVKRFHCDDHDPLRQHRANVISAYNFGRRLKTLARVSAIPIQDSHEV